MVYELSPPTVILPMSRVISHATVACLIHPQVPPEYLSVDPLMPEIYEVAVVDAPIVPTDHHQAPPPKPPNYLYAACLLVHVAS